jgi:hypothetical protein
VKEWWRLICAERYEKFMCSGLLPGIHCIVVAQTSDSML